MQVENNKFVKKRVPIPATCNIPNIGVEECHNIETWKNEETEYLMPVTKAEFEDLCRNYFQNLVRCRTFQANSHEQRREYNKMITDIAKLTEFVKVFINNILMYLHLNNKQQYILMLSSCSTYVPGHVPNVDNMSERQNCKVTGKLFESKELFEINVCVCTTKKTSEKWLVHTSLRDFVLAMYSIYNMEKFVTEKTADFATVTCQEYKELFCEAMVESVETLTKIISYSINN
jgi:hypothetical protein